MLLTSKSRVASSTTARGPASPDVATGLRGIVQWANTANNHVLTIDCRRERS